MPDVNKYGTNEKGSVLVMTIFMVFILVIMISVIGTYTMGSYKNQEHLINTNQAFFMAQSGLNAAKATMTADPESAPLSGHFYPDDDPWLTSSTYDLSTGNSFEVWANYDATGSLFNIVSKGIAQNKSRLLVVNFKRNVSGIFMEGTKILETEDLRPYYNGEYLWPPYPFNPPTGLPNEGLISLTKASRTITGDHRYSGISLSQSSTLTINGPANILVEGNITLQKSKLIIGGTGPVNIFLTGNYSADNNSSMEVSQPLILTLKSDPNVPQEIALGNNFQSTAGTAKDFLIVSATDGYTETTQTSINIDFKNNTELRGGIFAPNAVVNMVGSSSPKIIGAIVAKEIYSSSGLPADHVQYDPAIFEIPGVTEYSSSVEIIYDTWGDYEWE